MKLTEILRRKRRATELNSTSSKYFAWPSFCVFFNQPYHALHKGFHLTYILRIVLENFVLLIWTILAIWNKSLTDLSHLGRYNFKQFPSPFSLLQQLDLFPVFQWQHPPCQHDRAAKKISCFIFTFFCLGLTCYSYKLCIWAPTCPEKQQNKIMQT